MDITEQWSKTVNDAIRGFSSSKETREDLRQECYMRILEIQDTINGIHQDQGLANAQKFVYRICVNRCIKLVKAEKKYESLLSHEHHEHPEHHKETELSRYNGVEIDSAIKFLSREEQYVIRGMFFMGMSVEQIATSLGTSTRWVNKLKNRALDQLRKEII